MLKVSKEKTAKIIPNAVGLATAEEKHVFGSLLSRDSTFKFLTHVWKRAVRQQRPSAAAAAAAVAAAANAAAASGAAATPTARAPIIQQVTTVRIPYRAFMYSTKE